VRRLRVVYERTLYYHAGERSQYATLSDDVLSQAATAKTKASTTRRQGPRRVMLYGTTVRVADPIARRSVAVIATVPGFSAWSSFSPIDCAIPLTDEVVYG
jgi:hypothetical protein